MPPRSKVSTRRGGAAAAAAAASKQPKLSFGKTANSGISKPNLRSSSGGGAKSKDKDVADKIAAIERVDLTGPTADVASEDTTHDTHEDTDGKEQETEQEHEQEQEHPLVLPPSLSSKDKDVDFGTATTTTIAFRDQARQEEAAPLTPEEQEASRVSEAQIRRYWTAKEAERTTKRVHQQGMSLHEKILREFDMSTQFGNCIGIARTRRWKLASELGLKPPIEVLAVLLKEGAKDGREGSAAKVQRAYVDKLLTSSFIVTED